MDFPALIEQCAPAVSVLTMSAIVKQESNFNPYAIGVNGDYILERQPESKQEAIEAVSWLEQQGQTNLDLGISQISKRNREYFNLSTSDSFDACQNINVGAAILSDNYTRSVNSGLSEQDALRAAISEYNTGSKTAGYKNGYVQKVIKNVGIAKVTVPDIISTVAKVDVTPEKPKRAYSEIVISNVKNSEKNENIYSQEEGQRSLFVYE